MFTGIIQSIAAVKKAEQRNSSLILMIATPRGWKLKPGDSIATDGVCLTVTKIGRGWYQTELMAETLERTTFGRHVPQKVNLERPLRPRDFLDGHIAQGHVDVVGVIRNKEQITKNKIAIYVVYFPKKFSKLVVEKGSIAVDGISLTIVEVGVGWFSVALITFTLTHTTIGAKQAGDLVNLEFDILGKYIMKYAVK